MQETELYAPVKNWLIAQGFEVKAEIGAADVVGCRAGEDPVVIELKTGFSLTLLQQGVARQRLSDWVYVAVPRWKGKSGWRSFKANVGLCKRLGLGVISVNLADGSVQVHADPVEFKPRKSKPRKGALLKEFSRRVGDPNQGGTRGSIVTGYQQEAERCLAYLVQHGPSRGADVAKGAEAPMATTIMRHNHYGWFEKVERGVYDASALGRSQTSA